METKCYLGRAGQASPCPTTSRPARAAWQEGRLVSNVIEDRPRHSQGGTAIGGYGKEPCSAHISPAAHGAEVPPCRPANFPSQGHVANGALRLNRPNGLCPATQLCGVAQKQPPQLPPIEGTRARLTLC